VSFAADFALDADNLEEVIGFWRSLLGGD
jgi:hypothetical protein